MYFDEPHLFFSDSYNFPVEGTLEKLFGFTLEVSIQECKATIFNASFLMKLKSLRNLHPYIYSMREIFVVERARLEHLHLHIRLEVSNMLVKVSSPSILE